LIQMNGIEGQVTNFNNSKLVFPVAEYNRILKNKFTQIDKIMKDSVSIADLGSGGGYVKAMRLSVFALESFRDELEGFNPEGKSEDFVKSFKKDMKNKADELNKQAQEFRTSAIKKIEKENILSSDNGWFLVKNNAIIPEYFNEAGIVLMDKAGAK
jgi:hypothetical protein